MKRTTPLVPMRFNTFICILVFGFLSSSLWGQHQAKVWDTGDGLSNNWVSDIAQDEQGYIWLATQYGVNRFDGYTFESFTHNPEDANSPIANWVKRIAIKSKNELWLGVDYGGLDAYNSKTNEFDHKTLMYEGDTIVSINKLLHTQKEGLYIASNRGLFKKSDSVDTFNRIAEGRVSDLRQNAKGQVFFLSNATIYRYDNSTNSVEKIFENTRQKIRNIFIDSANRLYVLYSDKVVALRLTEGTYGPGATFKIDALVSLLFADSAIIEDAEHRIWIGGKKGISVINRYRSGVRFYPYQTLFENALPGAQALSFYEDMHRNMWVGTNKGLAFISSFKTRFPSKRRLANTDILHDIRAFYEVDKTLLIAADEGLFRMDTENRMEKILSLKIYGMHATRSGKLYAIGQGLYEIDTASFIAKTISTKYFKGAWSIVEDQKDDLWLIGDKNLIRYHKNTGMFETFNADNTPTLLHPPRIDLLVDSKGRLWVCTLNSGVYLLENPHELSLGATPVFKNINHETDNVHSLSNRLATSLLETSDGTIWVGTDAGLNAIDPTTLAVKRYLKKDGLKDEKIMALVEDDFGNLWGSTVGNGIFQFNRKTEQFNFLSKEDGLISNNFLLSSAYKGHDGILFFGSDNGIQEIDPVLFNSFTPPKIDFFFTSVEAFKSSGTTRAHALRLENNAMTLAHDDNSFLVSYTTLNYHLAGKTQYQYRIHPFDEAWQDNGSDRTILFNNLRPGTYELEVAAINPDLEFTTNTIRLKFIIKPPWWASNWAYLAYFLTFACVLLGVHQYVLKNKLERAENRRLQELDSFKTDFFNNVAHELKTPLTLISGMANTLRKKRGKHMDKSISTILRKSNELNDLVNQILDLSKLEVGKLNLDKARGDIIVYLKYLMYSFESLARAKEIRLHFLTNLETLVMDFDAQQIKHIGTNLMSNALKNTPVKGDIYLQITQEGDWCIIALKDNGVGIPQEEIPHIFERYHQGKGQMGGTGIGLSLTKELVELMNGTIRVKSSVGKGTSFRVALPIERQATKEVQLELPAQPNPFQKGEPLTHLGSDSNEYPLIHIIEDNLDICYYLGEILGRHYRLRFSHHGDAGLEKIVETMPDLVITDLMMPGKNGFELCHDLKSNLITDHIPVVMITAKSDMDSRLEGLRRGADVYLEKPFDEEELLLILDKLLEQRAALRQKFNSPDAWREEAVSKEEKTHEFVLRIRAIVERHMDDSTFGILSLCRYAGISRSHLHRKLKSLTGHSTSSFIQLVRLQKALELLKNPEINVSEAAYAVGFEDPSYFSRQFSKTFGHPPSETCKSL